MPDEAKLMELKAKKLARPTLEQILELMGRTIKHNASPEALTEYAAVKATTDEYLTQFTLPHVVKSSHMCLSCDSRLSVYGGGISAAFMSSFTWGLMHGEGMCGHCHWPARMYHQSPDLRFTLILQYHPDEMKLPKTEDLPYSMEEA